MKTFKPALLAFATVLALSGCASLNLGAQSTNSSSPSVAEVPSNYMAPQSQVYLFFDLLENKELSKLVKVSQSAIKNYPEAFASLKQAAANLESSDTGYYPTLALLAAKTTGKEALASSHLIAGLTTSWEQNLIQAWSQSELKGQPAANDVAVFYAAALSEAYLANNRLQLLLAVKTKEVALLQRASELSAKASSAGLKTNANSEALREVLATTAAKKSAIESALAKNKLILSALTTAPANVIDSFVSKSTKPVKLQASEMSPTIGYRQLYSRSDVLASVRTLSDMLKLEHKELQKKMPRPAVQGAVSLLDAQKGIAGKSNYVGPTLFNAVMFNAGLPAESPKISLGIEQYYTGVRNSLNKAAAELDASISLINNANKTLMQAAQNASIVQAELDQKNADYVASKGSELELLAVARKRLLAEQDLINSVYMSNVGMIGFYKSVGASWVLAPSTKKIVKQNEVQK